MVGGEYEAAVICCSDALFPLVVNETTNRTQTQTQTQTQTLHMAPLFMFGSGSLTEKGKLRTPSNKY